MEQMASLGEQMLDIPEILSWLEPAPAVAKNSEHRNLLERFFNAAVSAQGKDKFMKYGFRWELDKGGDKKEK